MADAPISSSGSVVLVDGATRTREATVDASGNLQVRSVNAMVPQAYDEVDLTYNTDGTLNVATFKSAGTTVATLTCTYTSGNLTTVART